MAIIDAKDLRDEITIERAVTSSGFDGAGSGGWEPVDTVWAQVRDMLPSRSERLSGGINVAARPARVRMRHRTDITPSMRFVMGSRIMQIVSGPAVLGSREGLEFMVEDYSTAGNAA
jgi:head-tail adaptor